LEHVHKGLGEMHQLAHGVGDLKKVLANVKTRGTWGEVQCGNILEQLLTRDQFEIQKAVIPGRAEHVDFAIKLPGKGNDPVWLPIDAKCPMDTYHIIVDAEERMDMEGRKQAIKELERHMIQEAKSMSSKYIHPPHTTDFGIMYVPIEGMYAELLRCDQLQQTLQNTYRVILAGPTTLAALLNSLQMGFRTLAIEQRSSDVWKVLAVVKTEFGKFGDILEKTQKKLQEAGNTIETASRKSRTIERKLRGVETLPEHEPEVSELAGSGVESVPTLGF